MSLPLIRLDTLGPRGLEITPDAWALACAAEGAGGPVQGLTGRIHLERHDKQIFVHGELAATVTLPCVRCLAPLSLALAGPFACLYSPLAAVPEKGEDDDTEPEVPPALSGRVEEFGEYDGVALDLRDVVREFFALETPAQPRCADGSTDEDAACLARWAALAGPVSDADAPQSGAFAALASLKIQK